MPFSRETFASKKVLNIIEQIASGMTKECGEATAPQRIIDLARANNQNGYTLLGKTCGLFLLVEGRKILCSAMLCSATQISFRWTPPKHRRKGYASEILRRIGDLWKTLPNTPIWVASNNYLWKGNAKAGWVSQNLPNKDNTQDWYPPWAVERYKKISDYYYQQRITFNQKMADSQEDKKWEYDDEFITGIADRASMERVSLCKVY